MTRSFFPPSVSHLTQTICHNPNQLKTLSKTKQRGAFYRTDTHSPVAITVF